MLWWRILRQNPNDLFGPEVAKLRNQTWGDRIPQPGYLGNDYVPGGIMFVSMNPGGSQRDRPGTTDEQQLLALKKLGECARADSLRGFANLRAVLERIMPTWSIYRNFVAPILECAKLRFSHVVYLNLLKWRTQKDAALDRLYALSWQHHTREQFDLLRPGVVIAIGLGSGDAFKQLNSNDVRLFKIRRIMNNIHPEGRAEIKRICAWLGNRAHAAQQPAAPDSGRRARGEVTGVCARCR